MLDNICFGTLFLSPLESYPYNQIKITEINFDLFYTPVRERLWSG